MLRISINVLLFCTFVMLFLSCNKISDKNTKFDIMETTISDIHKSYKSGELTCRELVAIYLNRIETYDQASKLNSIVVINPNALKRAEELDREFKRTNKLRPLHGIPIIVKDNYDTYDLQTAGGSLAMKGFLPPDD